MKHHNSVKNKKSDYKRKARSFEKELERTQHNFIFEVDGENGEGTGDEMEVHLLKIEIQNLKEKNQESEKIICRLKQELESAQQKRVDEEQSVLINLECENMEVKFGQEELENQLLQQGAVIAELELQKKELREFIIEQNKQVPAEGRAEPLQHSEPEMDIFNDSCLSEYCDKLSRRIFEETVCYHLSERYFSPVIRGGDRMGPQFSYFSQESCPLYKLYQAFNSEPVYKFFSGSQVPEDASTKKMFYSHSRIIKAHR